MTVDEPLLELVDLTKHFGRIMVAEELSLRVGEGELVGIVGPNGAGKTTLFSMIGGDVRPDSGTIRFRGRDVRGIGPPGRCRLGIGRTYQVPRPFEHMTVFENVLVAASRGAGLSRRAAYELAAATLAETGLERDANRPAGELGLVHRKRLEMARALASEPRMLLLDEVAGGLTDAEVGELLQIVAGIGRRGITVIWIEHVVNALVHVVTRLVCLAAGRVVNDGLPEEVLASPQVKEVFLGSDYLEQAAAAAGGSTSATRETP